MTALLESDLPKGDIIRGQYSFDHAFDPDDPRLDMDPNGVKKRGDGYAGMHYDNMFDQGSSLPDEATGLTPGARINKDPNYDFEVNGLSIVDGLGGAASAEIAKRRPVNTEDAKAWLELNAPNYQEDKTTEDKDEDKISADAEAWLKQHDPNYKQKAWQ